MANILTPRKRQLLDFLAKGLSNKQIALRMDIRIKTVESMIRSLYSDLEISGGRVSLANYWAGTLEKEAAQQRDIAEHRTIVFEAAGDPVVLAVQNKMAERSRFGIDKYGVTLERTDLTTLDWINHLQQELMDAVLYIEAFKKRYKLDGN